MSEEVKIKVSQPMFELGELERFDNNIHSIVEEYSKLMFKEKDQILTQRIIMKQEEEIKRLKEEYVMLQNASDEVEEEKDKEIERLKDDNKYLNKVNIELSSEKNRLKSIIKEVREYINKISSEPNVFRHYAIDGDCKKCLLKILDKENNNEDNNKNINS